MSNNRVVETISLFRSQLQHRRFDDETLRILESLLISKDVKSLLEMRSCLRDFMRSESVYVLKELLEKPVDQKLTVLEFFVRAFALVADVESCLALKYEALVLRERTSVSREWLRVSKEEWFGFAKDSLHNGFYSIVVKGCDNALSCTQLADAEINLKIKKLKDIAVNLVASHSVQAQTAEHFKRKTTQLNEKRGLDITDTQCLASSMFRNGIKSRNMQKLRELQNCQPSK